MIEAVCFVFAVSLCFDLAKKEHEDTFMSVVLGLGFICFLCWFFWNLGMK